MDVTKLRAEMYKRGINVDKLCKMTGIDRSRMYRRLESSEKTTLCEAKRIKEALGLTNMEAIEIFL